MGRVGAEAERRLLREPGCSLSPVFAAAAILAAYLAGAAIAAPPAMAGESVPPRGDEASSSGGGATAGRPGETAPGTGAPEKVEMEPVTVTASRSAEQRLSEVPQYATVISREEVEKSGARDLGELLRGRTGLTLTSYGGPGTMTNLALRGTSSSQTLVLVDGRPVQDIANGTPDFSRFPVEDIERVEILRGPAGAMYGSFAMGGAVNIITRRTVSDRPAFSLRSGYGSWNTFDERISHGWKKGIVDYDIAAAFRRSDDGYRRNSDFQSRDATARIGIEPVREFRAEYRFGYRWDWLGLPGPVPPVGFPAPYGNRRVTSKFDRQNGEIYRNDLTLEFRPVPEVALRGKAYLDLDRLHSFFRYNSFDPSTFAPYRADNYNAYHATVTGQEISARWTVVPEYTVSAGADFRQEKLDARMTEINHDTRAGVTRTEWDPMVHKSGVWMRHEWRAMEHIRLVGSVRYDWHSEFGDHWTASGGMVIDATKGTRVRFHGGTSYRAPTMNDLYWPQGGNEDLEPEVGWSFETSVEQKLFDDRLSLHSGYFFWRTDDKIQWAPDASGMFWTPQNLNRQTCHGVEVEARARPIRPLEISLRYHFLYSLQKNREIVYYDFMTGDIRMDDIERVAAYLPRHNFAAEVAYSAPWGTRFAVQEQATSKRVAYYPDYSGAPVIRMRRKESDALAITNVLISHSFRKLLPKSFRGDVEIYGIARNIFNDRGFEQFGNSYSDRDFPIPPRNFEAGIRMTF
ncbi:MAG: TonB-dependent receptor [Planctomycetota bacterium]|nr:TonB-dependent receptor [Planctomycetota bacterium]